MSLTITGIGTTEVLTGIADATSTGGGAATVEIHASGGGGLLATFTLPAPEFTLVSGRLTLNGAPLSATAGASGAPALFYLFNRAGAVVLTGSIAATGAFDLYSGPHQVQSGNTQRLNQLVFHVDGPAVKSYGSLTLA